MRNISCYVGVSVFFVLLQFFYAGSLSKIFNSVEDVHEVWVFQHGTKIQCIWASAQNTVFLFIGCEYFFEMLIFYYIDHYWNSERAQFL